MRATLDRIAKRHGGGGSEQDGERVHRQDMAHAHIDLGVDGGREVEEEWDGEEEQLAAVVPDACKRREGKQDQQKQRGFDEKGGGQVEPHRVLVEMSEHKRRPVGRDEQNVRPAEEVGLGQEMVLCEEEDGGLLEWVLEACRVLCQSGDNAEGARARCVAETVRRPEADVADNDDRGERAQVDAESFSTRGGECEQRVGADEQQVCQPRAGRVWAGSARRSAWWRA